MIGRKVTNFTLAEIMAHTNPACLAVGFVLDGSNSGSKNQPSTKSITTVKAGRKDENMKNIMLIVFSTNFTKLLLSLKYSEILKNTVCLEKCFEYFFFIIAKRF